MVPVYYEDGKTLLADTTKEWYDYDKHNWANAVLVRNASNYLESDGTPKKDKVNQEVSDILQYYVWIPRYKYELFSNATNVDNMINSGNTPAQKINIEFVGTDEVNDSTKSEKNGYNKGESYVHPAFTFGTKELSGIWIGKFEPSHTTLSNHTTANQLGCSNENCTNADGIRILPNKISITFDNVANQFYASRSIERSGNPFGLTESQVDTHMMSNFEWGAVAYLSSSKYGRYNSDGSCISSGCEIWINNTMSRSVCTDGYNGNHCGGTVTGCSAISSASDNVRASMTTCGGDAYNWNGTTNNGRSSTSGNIYGIYDMSGGTLEYVMGNMAQNGNINAYTVQNSGFSSQPSAKYLQLYEYGTTELVHTRGKLGDATRETLATFNSNTGSWYSDYALFVSSSYPWFNRGGRATNGADAGVFAFNRLHGGAITHTSFRVVLSAQ